MKGAFWWVDRWRQSTAYTDMTAEERGVYRELIDELWLRDGVIPTDDRILARLAGGDAVWARVKKAVLAHFVKTPSGYRNSTHDKISAESKKRAEKQANYRNKKGNVTGTFQQRDGNKDQEVPASLFTASLLHSTSSPPGAERREGGPEPSMPGMNGTHPPDRLVAAQISLLLDDLVASVEEIFPGQELPRDMTRPAMAKLLSNKTLVPGDLERVKPAYRNYLIAVRSGTIKYSFPKFLSVFPRYIEAQS